MKEKFGCLPTGEQTYLYSIKNGSMEAYISDFGATLVRLYVPDREGNRADVVLGFDNCNSYRQSTSYFGAIVGRNANRINGAAFSLNGKEFHLTANQNGNSLHSGPDSYAFRLWNVKHWDDASISLTLHSPDSDQGFPGNADIQVTYKLENTGTLRIIYDAISDKDTVFNLTNHSFFNLAGHQHPEHCLNQILLLPTDHFVVCDDRSIPTGELRNVEGTPFDFRSSKEIGKDILEDYDQFRFQGGYDHTFTVSADPCAVLKDPVSGRTLSISTDRPGIHLYSGNYLAGDVGKDGVRYCYRGGIAFETQCYPDSVHHPEWVQPFVKAGEHWHSETKYTFS